jgi:arylsulfatase
VFNHYPFGWAWAGNTPFQRWKREVHEGGVADPFIIHWPRGIQAKGEFRDQYVHAVDVVPTVLEMLGIEPPQEIKGVTQSPLEGHSFAPTLGDATARSRHDTQYYEMLGNRAVYHRGWKAVTYHGTQGMIYDGVTDPMKPFDEDRWELYNVAEDFAEARDLADEHPQKLRELQDIWWVHAARYNVLPLNAQIVGRSIGRPHVAGPRKRFVYYPGGAPIGMPAGVNVKNRSHTITAEVTIPEGGAEGVLFSNGDRFGGFSMYVHENRLKYTYNFLDRWRENIASADQLSPGSHRFAFSFEKTGSEFFGAGGTMRLYVDGNEVAQGELKQTAPFVFGLFEALQCGRQVGSAVSNDYVSPFAFTGQLHRVIVDVSGHEPPRDLEQEAQIEMARQ